MALTTIASRQATGGSYPHNFIISIQVDTISQDVANNRGTYRIRAQIKNNSAGTPYNIIAGDNAYYMRINNVNDVSGYKPVDFRASTVHEIVDKNVVINHDANGNLTFEVEARQAVDGISSFDYAWAEGNYTAAQIKRASKITAGAADIDTAIPVTITAEQAGVTHDIVVKYGAMTIKTILNAGNPSNITLTAGEWAALYALTPSAITFNLTIELTTKLSGASIGTNSATAAITYPAAVIPTLTSVTVADLDAVVPGVAGAGNFVQLLSDLRLTMNSVAGAKGSTIAEYELKVNGTNYGTNIYDFTPAVSGAYAVTARVKDSRGRWSAERALSFSVIAYERPKITGHSVVRANAGGTVEALGTYSKHTGVLTVKSIMAGTEKNVLKYKIDKVTGGTVTNILALQIIAGLTSTINHILGTYAIDTAQVFRITAYDKFNESFVSDFTMPSARVPFALSKTGASIGGIFDNSDTAVAQIYGDLNVKDGGKLLFNGIERPYDRLITSSQDLNSFVETGNYYCPSNATVATLSNSPTVNAFSLIVTKNAGISQLLIPYAAASHEIWHRNLYNHIWGAWARIDALSVPAVTVDGPIVGDYLNGYQNLRTGLRRVWKTYVVTILAAEMLATGPTGMYKSGWKVPGNWAAGFTAVPRLTSFILTCGALKWPYLGTVLTPTATAAGNFFILKHTDDDSPITVYIEAEGPY